MGLKRLKLPIFLTIVCENSDCLFVVAWPLCSASAGLLKPSNRDQRFAIGISGPCAVPSDMIDGVRDDSSLIPPTMCGGSDPLEVFESEVPEVSSNVRTKGTS